MNIQKSHVIAGAIYSTVICLVSFGVGFYTAYSQQEDLTKPAMLQLEKIHQQLFESRVLDSYSRFRLDVLNLRAIQSNEQPLNTEYYELMLRKNIGKRILEIKQDLGKWKDPEMLEKVQATIRLAEELITSGNDDS